MMMMWLTLLFVAMKMMGYIDWSWWLVVTPIFIGFAVDLILIIISTKYW